MNRIDRGLKYAEKAATLSNNEKFRVGAAIFRGKRLISMGWNNTWKTHPESKARFKACHAEFAAIQGNYKYDLIGATIYVVRITNANRRGMAKPCKYCEEVIAAAGIEQVIYTNQKGEPEYAA